MGAFVYFFANILLFLLFEKYILLKQIDDLMSLTLMQTTDVNRSCNITRFNNRS